MCRRYCKLGFHPLDLVDWASAKQTLEFPAELRGAVIAHLRAGGSRRHALTHHMQTRLMQTDRLHVLHRRSFGHSLEMGMEGRYAHSDLPCQLFNTEVGIK